MPHGAIKLGAAKHIMPLNKMAGYVVKHQF